ncbi:serine/threonine-protein kinase [Streptomyces sp. NPDC092296]|uniref:serine/threonine-protein kinase n=1 Tax=Streptomyces sp. NPDC092296 TaxID=3366012 RepID=UPI0037F191A2
MEPLGPDDPQQIGGYRLLRRLGAGGMGRVYLGRTAGGRTVAVKVVRPDLADDAEFRARFRQEVAAARRVGGAWTAPVLDADTEGPQPWVATGYVAGPALDAAVRSTGPLPEHVVRALGAGLADALAAVHATGLVHRDVKPSNVLLALDGPRLIDFGIARALDAASSLTRTGYVVGSPGYLSPEQAAGQEAGPAGDVFSLGAVLAYAATGTPPFGQGVSAAVLLYRVLHEQPDLGPLAGPLRDAVAACLAKEAAQRPDPGELRELLAEGGETARLLRDGWLPPALSAAVGRRAVELLDLEGEAADPAAGPWPVPAGGSGSGSGVRPVTGAFGPPAADWTPTDTATPAEPAAGLAPGLAPGLAAGSGDAGPPLGWTPTQQVRPAEPPAAAVAQPAPAAPPRRRGGAKAAPAAGVLLLLAGGATALVLLLHGNRDGDGSSSGSADGARSGGPTAARTDSPTHGRTSGPARSPEASGAAVP